MTSILRFVCYSFVICHPKIRSNGNTRVAVSAKTFTTAYHACTKNVFFLVETLFSVSECASNVTVFAAIHGLMNVLNGIYRVSRWLSRMWMYAERLSLLCSLLHWPNGKEFGGWCGWRMRRHIEPVCDKWDFPRFELFGWWAVECARCATHTHSHTLFLLAWSVVVAVAASTADDSIGGGGICTNSKQPFLKVYAMWRWSICVLAIIFIHFEHHSVLSCFASLCAACNSLVLPVQIYIIVCDFSSSIFLLFFLLLPLLFILSLLPVHLTRARAMCNVSAFQFSSFPFYYIHTDLENRRRNFVEIIYGRCC